MTNRIHNFNAGPATLPLDVLQEVQAEFLNYNNTGMSVLEITHRSKDYENINAQAEASLKELLGLNDDYQVLFLQGGASLQFAMIALNFLPQGQTADYIVSGVWAEKALQEAQLIGQTHIAASSADQNHRRIPSAAEISLSANPAYVHLTSNNTIYGTQWQQFPDVGAAPLFADMSSDILSRSFDASKFSLIYAGAQKNLGPAGVTVVIARKALLENSPKTIPTMLRYQTHAQKASLYNTPPSFSVYMVERVLNWIKTQGGLTAMEQHNRTKAALIYDAIDQSGGYYQGYAHPDSRSLMNITFRLDNAQLDGQFVLEAAKAGLGGLKGYRSLGGIRASVYNAMTMQGCQALRDFMLEFQRQHG